MAARHNPPPLLRCLLLLSLLVVTTFAAIAAGDDAGIAVYWGRDGGEGSIEDACRTGNYAYLVIAFLSDFGSGRTPRLDITAHCNPTVGGCTYLSREIEDCQANGVKVLLSLGGPQGNYSLADSADAMAVANYLWETFLGGGSSDRPLGDAVLDGIDLYIENTTSDLHWDYLVRVLFERSTPERKVYLSAAAECRFPGKQVHRAITTGLLDYVWVKVYNDSDCVYDVENSNTVLSPWMEWANSVFARRLLLSLLAGEDGYSIGYISPDDLMEKVLPDIKRYPLYGGIMLWNRYLDDHNFYSDKVKPHINRTDDPVLRQTA